MSAIKLISINVLIIAASVLMVVLALMLPSKWDKAIALKICRDGTPILRLQDGSIWARRNGFTAYRTMPVQFPPNLDAMSPEEL